MTLEVVGKKKKHNKNSVTFRSSLLAFDLRETSLFEWVSLAQIHFLFFLRDTSWAYEIPLDWSNLPGENLSKYRLGTLRLNFLTIFVIYCLNIEILVTAFIWTEFLNSERIFSHRKLFPELSSTQVRRLNQPSLQSWTLLTLVRHEWCGVFIGTKITSDYLRRVISLRYCWWGQWKKTFFSSQEQWTML